MSREEKKGNTQTKKMTSIVRKLQWHMARKAFFQYIKMDVLICILLAVGWLLDREYVQVGTISIYNSRKIIHVRTIRKWCYLVQNKHGEKLLELPLYNGLCVLGICMGIVFLFQLIAVVTLFVKEEWKIRDMLHPINEIALKADELSRMEFTGEKYQVIEDAISKLQPEEEISFGDKDLQGIEAAMNNLLYRMREVNKQQARFVNDASHELRTPIAVIEGYVNMLARWGTEDEKVLEESIAALQRESGHMKHLVEQLLFLARGDSGKTQLELKEISLKECMQEVYEESLLIDEKHIYRFRAGENPIMVIADGGMLKQAVRILVDNAAKYTKEQEEIILSVGMTEQGEAYLQVQDSGIGMEMEDLKHMFERFYRADDARKYKGTGLGLSIAKWIVEKHGGHFEVLSRTELGSRICICVPLQK